ncbi:MAG: hypothetical protein KDD69_09500 [Bdellovibrionales bacterium]|nr:hypothetical protein [Bdellovibrionales bacterium]
MMMDDDEDFDFYDEEKQYDTDRAALVSLPTLEYYQRTYASSMANEDQKAVRAFKQYESQEKVRRLQNELMSIKGSLVREGTLDRLVGKKRKGKWNGYDRWASLMLQWIVSSKR